MARKFLKYLVLLVITGNLALIAIVLLGRQTPPPRPIPNPNGYDDLVRAGQMVVGNFNNFNTITLKELSGLVSSNEASLGLLRVGLSHECRVANASLPIYNWRNLAFLFGAAGRLAQLEGRTNDMADAYVDAIRFGQEECRGGILTSRQIGIACEKIGSMPLEKLKNVFDAKKCGEIAQKLETIDAREEPVEETLRQENIWRRKVSGFRDQIEFIIRHKEIQKLNGRVGSQIRSNTLQRTKLMVAFAARAYELENGTRPQNIADLVPAYLKGIPKDPVTGKDLSLGP